MGGCTTSVTVEGTIPTPLVAKIPVNVGIYYSDNFKQFRHEENIRQEGNWKVDMGAHNLLFFQNLMSALFVNVRELNQPPLAEENVAGLDGILVPEIVKYGFLTPNISGLKFYSAAIHYRMTLYSIENEKVGEWTIVGYGKSESTLFGTTESLGEATVLAIRDGGARIAMEMDSQPVVQRWLEDVKKK
jgi:hypothetical protein